MVLKQYEVESLETTNNEIENWEMVCCALKVEVESKLALQWKVHVE